MKYFIYVFGVLVFCFNLSVLAQPGRLDSTFGSDGIFKKDLLNVTAIIPQQNGEIICFGQNEPTGISVLRCAANASILSQYNYEFGLNAFVEITDAVSLNDGSIVGIGVYDFKGSFFKFHANGSIDTSFGTNGFLMIPFANEFQRIILQKNGKMVIWGKDEQSHILFRFDSNFQLDSSFGTNGILKITVPNGFFYFSKLAIQKDDKIVHATVNYNDLTIRRYTTSGALDNQFAISGAFNLNFNHRVYRAQPIILASGKICVLVQDSLYASLLKLNPDGVLDSTFGTNGMLRISIPGKGFYLTDLAQQVDGKILIAGNIGEVGKLTSCFWLQRRFEDGSLDFSFGDSSVTQTPFSYKYVGMQKMVLQKNGDILLGGDSDFDSPVSIPGYYFMMTRYLLDLNLGIIDFSKESFPLQIYPNPIQSSSTLSFSLQHAENLSIDLFNLQGQKIKSFINQQYFTQGEHKIDLLFNDMHKPGYYLLRINNGEQVITIKVLRQ